jgi:predicted AAA+ superfamily ATPase
MVNINDIKSAIIDREEELQKKFKNEKIIPREALIQIKIPTDAAFVITGPRRGGKSILAYMLAGKKCAYVNFDDERLQMNAAELNKVLEAVYSLKGEMDLLVFDEIQNINGWELFISRLVQTKRIIITGSNAHLLSKELATHLTGRHIDYALFPFSFCEFLRSKDIKYDINSTLDRAKIKDMFTEYLENGGFPLVQKLGKSFLAETYKDVIERDVLQRYKVKHSTVLKELAGYLVSNSANEISFHKLKNIFNVKSIHTVKNYVGYLQNTYLIFSLERFSFKHKEQMRAPRKVYGIDTGLVQTISSKASENKGNMLENIVAIQLFRDAQNSDNKVYYWKDHQQREVDFVIKKKDKVISLIQVTDISARIELARREIISLVKASNELKCSELMVLTRDYNAQEKIGKKTIKFVPVWRWLLEK